MQLVDILEGLMPIFITIEADAKNQEPTENAHFAQDSEDSNLQIGSKTKKSSMEKQIPVQEIQADPCGNGWEKSTLRQTTSHLHCLEFLTHMTMSLH